MRKGAFTAVSLLFVLLMIASTEAAGAGSTGAIPKLGREDIERGDGLAGTLRVRPRTVEPGGRIGVRLANLGPSGMAFSLGVGVERREDGVWRDVTLEALGLLLYPAVMASAGPGEVYRFGRFTLMPELEPGRYRVVKTVFRDDWEAQLKLDGRFFVRRLSGRVARSG